MKWVLAESDDRVVALLSEQAGLHPLIARLMVNRSIADPMAAQTFLACDLAALSDPALFTQMGKAISRIRSAIAAGTRIVVYGDYDVDGVTGASLLYLTLRDMGADVGCYIPDRLTEGYGLNAHALQKIKATGAGLVITVDCGISNLREAEVARSLGLDLIVTDHHQFANPKSKLLNPEENRVSSELGVQILDSGTVLPDAYAILHPELISPEVPSSLRNAVSVLTGVGIAFKLAQALMELQPDDRRLLHYLDLVTLGTVADVGRITGENRILVKHGLTGSFFGHWHAEARCRGLEAGLRPERESNRGWCRGLYACPENQRQRQAGERRRGIPAAHHVVARRGCESGRNARLGEQGASVRRGGHLGGS